eukprot:CAMPEP_0119304966 /NCGR_PEP_ID=MMETSP1333-20130426/6058_1 /TAXON_ID=418940 /ORGANISM="Scyphosphaera apsteinii, Strain RCC1455" /LENGTH=385 /DNA_ID=CAMNT_0007307949 /DNA_START=296 /DNA_END=1453 /DNA_ORIENTATION=+
MAIIFILWFAANKLGGMPSLLKPGRIRRVQHATESHPMPTTKAELHLWLFRNTHVRLPSAEQPIEYYEELYRQHCQISRKHAAPAKATSGSSSMPKVMSKSRLVALIASGCLFGAIVKCLLPRWLLRCFYLAASQLPYSMTAPRKLCDLTWAAEAAGCAIGVWLVGLGHDQPAIGDFGRALVYAAFVSASVTLYMETMISLALGPTLFFISPAACEFVLEVLPLARRLAAAPAVAAVAGFNQPPATIRSDCTRRRLAWPLRAALGTALVAASLNQHIDGRFVTQLRVAAQQIAYFDLRGAWSSLRDALFEAVPRQAEPSTTTDWSFTVLGLQPGSDPAEIKQAYRQLSLQWHPDKLDPGLSPEEREAATARFIDIRRAYELLTSK